MLSAARLPQVRAEANIYGMAWWSHGLWRRGSVRNELMSKKRESDWTLTGCVWNTERRLCTPWTGIQVRGAHWIASTTSQPMTPFSTALSLSNSLPPFSPSPQFDNKVEDGSSSNHLPSDTVHLRAAFCTSRRNTPPSVRPGREPRRRHDYRGRVVRVWNSIKNRLRSPVQGKRGVPKFHLHSGAHQDLLGHLSRQWPRLASTAECTMGVC